MSHVDTTSPVTHVSLCAGYGGIDIGLNRAVGNLRTIAFSEIEAFACANLVSKMEAGLLDCAPIWTNLKTFPWSEFRDRVDILSGGYPCQPFSAAGKRLGTDDPRHLWPYIADGITAMRPSVCFFENVEGHITLGLPDVIEDLAGMGYRTTWGIFSASEVGATHQRKRVFIMAHRGGDGHNWWPLQDRVCGRGVSQLPQPLQGGCSEIRSEVEGCSNDTRELAHRDGNGSPSGFPRSLQGNEGQSGVFINGSGQVWPSRPGQPQYEWEPPRVVGNAAEQGFPFSGGQCGSVGEPRTQQESERPDENLGNASGKGLEGSVEQSGLSEAGSERPNENLGNSRSAKLHGVSDRQAGESMASTWEPSDQRETQPSLGGNPHGASGGMGHAELCVSCDNRTDELRLLGNGVVPATAELAFRTLWEELTWK
jgi:site-specific DNA-cytosine methylase